MAAARTPWLLYGGAALGAGLGAYFLTRPAPARALPPAPPAPNPVPPDVITMPYGSFGRARWDQLVSRLRGSSSARLVFAMQAALASLGLLPSEPDGVWGQNTDAAVVSLTAALGLPIDAARPPVALVYGRIVAYLARRPGTRLLVQGFALPRGLIEQVNRESGEALSGFPPLQIYVAEDFGWRP